MDSCPLRNSACRLTVNTSVQNTLCTQDEHVSRNEVNACSGLCGLRSAPGAGAPVCLPLACGVPGLTLSIPSRDSGQHPASCPSPPRLHAGWVGGRQWPPAACLRPPEAHPGSGQALGLPLVESCHLGNVSPTQWDWHLLWQQEASEVTPFPTEREEQRSG